MITMDGLVYATPVRFVVANGEMFGWFPPDTPGEYYDWCYWGEATSQHLDAAAKAGVPIEFDDTFRM